MTKPSNQLEEPGEQADENSNRYKCNSVCSFFGGKPRKLIELLLNKELDSYITQEILEEYKDTIVYLQNKYNNKKVFVPLTYIISACKIIEGKTKVKICRDPDDDKFISCAIDAECLYIVSGDKDLLEIKEYEEVQIMTVSDFLDIVYKG